MLLDIFKSLAIVEIAGKHEPFLSARSRRYMYTAIARCGRFVEKISRLFSKKSLLKHGIFKRIFFESESRFFSTDSATEFTFGAKLLSVQIAVVIIVD